MKTGMIYRISFYVMLTVATKILCGDAADSRIDGLLPFVVAGAGVLAFVTVDQTPRLGLAREIANLLAVGTLAILYGEYKSDETQLIRALGHWVACLQLIKYFLPKTSEDDWFLFLLGLTQVLIGSVTNQGDSIGLWLFFWAMLAVWVLGLFFLEREAQRFGARGEEPAGPGEVVDPYHGLFDMAYVFLSFRVLALTLLLGGLFFLLLPRQVGATRARGGGGMARHLTGFGEEVKLGQLGEILENDSIVMTVELTDLELKPRRPANEPLWRGITLTRYEKGGWQRQNKGVIQSVKVLASKRTPDPSWSPIRQVIKLEPNDSTTLFAMRPVLDWPSRSAQMPSMNPIDGTLFRIETRGGYDYEVISDSNGEGPQIEEHPIQEDRRNSLLAMDKLLRDRLREIAEPIVEGLPAEGREGVAVRARALEAYLRDSGAFGYTLEMSVTDPKVDPVVDFLTNRHEGHCEYFASALTLLLRSVGIPARMVIGFKGGDWNEITQMMSVRQKHAHSWVEALIEAEPQKAPLWLTLDPTPGTERAQSIAQVGSIPSRLRSLTDLVRYVWVFYILGYDSARQNRILYEPIAATVKAVREGYATIWGWVKHTFARLFDFQTWGSFISVRGFVVTFILGTLLVLVVKFLGWLLARLMSWWRGPQDDSAGLTAGILFYRRLTQLLAEYELSRTPAETQGEFALRASRFLTGLGAGAQAMAAVPARIVDAFYRVRFGGRELSAETLTELEGQLDLLEERMRQSDGSSQA